MLNAGVIKNFDAISTLLGIDLAPSTELPSSQGKALKMRLYPGRYTRNSNSQCMPGQDVLDQVRPDFICLDSPSQTLLPVPKTTANNSGTYGVPSYYVPTPPTSVQQVMLDGIPSTDSIAQYQAYMDASLSASWEPSSSWG